jgi:hypothetical protein
MLLKVVQVKSTQETLQSLTSLVQLVEKLLSMRASLCGGPRLNMLLHHFPLLSVKLEGCEESQVLILSPTAVLVRLPIGYRFLDLGLLCFHHPFLLGREIQETGVLFEVSCGNAFNYILFNSKHNLPWNSGATFFNCEWLSSRI